MIRPTAVLALLLCAALPGTARAGDAPAAPADNPLRGGDVKALLDKAAEMKSKEARALGAALTALGEPAKDHGADLEFLVRYVLSETARAPRLLALESAQRIDAPGAAAAFLKAAQTDKDPIRVALALEAVGSVGTHDDVPSLLELVKSPNELTATAAADALARLGNSKDVEAILDAGLTHENSHVTDHTAWAVQDIVQKPKVAVEKYQKIASKKKDPRNVRAEATAALLLDKSADPHKWVPGFAAIRKALQDAPAAPAVRGSNPEHVAKVQAAVDWIKEKLPAEYWLLCASVSLIEPSAETNETMPDFDRDAIVVKLSDAVLPPNKLAYTLQMQAGVLWRKRIGEPYKSHRGWEPAIFDLYDLCVVGRMWDAGPGGLSREKFVAMMLGKKPWGTL